MTAALEPKMLTYWEPIHSDSAGACVYRRSVTAALEPKMLTYWGPIHGDNAGGHVFIGGR